MTSPDDQTPADPGQIDGTPEPPFSRDVLAAYHSGLLSEAASAHVRANLTTDDLAYLEALDRTASDLASWEVEPAAIPPDVAARMQRTISALSTTGPVRETPVQQDDSVVSIPRRRRFSTPALAAAAVVVVAMGIGIGILNRGSADGAPRGATDVATASTPPTTDVSALDRSETAQIMGALGADRSPFPSPEDLRACLVANHVAPDSTIVGTDRLMVRGSPAAVVLVSTGQAGRFLALVTGTDCGSGNPATITKTIIGG